MVKFRTGGRGTRSSRSSCCDPSVGDLAYLMQMDIRGVLTERLLIELVALAIESFLPCTAGTVDVVDACWTLACDVGACLSP